MSLNKKLMTGAVLRSWNYEGNAAGQTIAVKNGNGNYIPIIHAESVTCLEGCVNRVVLKKSILEKMGWAIVEE